MQPISFEVKSTRRSVSYDKSSLKRLKPHMNLARPLSFLNKSDITKDFVKSKSSSYLDFIGWINGRNHHDAAVDESPNRFGADFIVPMGVLKQIVLMLADPLTSQYLTITKCAGTVYIGKITALMANQRQHSDLEKDKQLPAIKFEHLMCEDTGVDQFNLNTAYFTWIKAQLNDHTLVVSGEIDACANIDGEMRYVELKLLEDPYNTYTYQDQQLTADRDYVKRRIYKFEGLQTMTWWLTATVLNEHLIICGVKDRQRQIEEIRKYSLDELCNLGKHVWEPKTVLNFLDQVLSFIKNSVTQDNCHVQTYSLEYTKGDSFIELVQTEINQTAVDRITVLHETGTDSREVERQPSNERKVRWGKRPTPS